jgi:hypothetical protein
MRSSELGALTALLAVAACAAPAARPSMPLEPARPPYVAPPPTPQVMIAAPADAAPQPVVLGSISEARRRELLLPAAYPFAPYSPPLPPAPRSVVVRTVEPAPNYVRYESAYRPYSPWYDAAADLGRIATYTAAGAIIGHQYHERGRGAAIGLGLALLGWPFDRCGWRSPWRW